MFCPSTAAVDINKCIVHPIAEAHIYIYIFRLKLNKYQDLTFTYLHIIYYWEIEIKYFKELAFVHWKWDTCE